MTRPEMLAVSASAAGTAGVLVGDADGRGVGVAVRLGVGEALGWGVVVGLDVAVGVGVGVGVGVAERVGVGVAEGVGVDAALPEALGVGVGVEAADRVGDGVATAAVPVGESGVSAEAAGATRVEPTRVNPTTAVIQARSNDRAGARIVPPPGGLTAGSAGFGSRGSARKRLPLGQSYRNLGVGCKLAVGARLRTAAEPPSRCPSSRRSRG